jgi:hypothetical protein
MKDLFSFVVVFVGAFLFGFSLALILWHPVELELMDDELTSIMICRMSTNRSGIITARCADFDKIVGAMQSASPESL